MDCRNCNTPITTNQKFCSNCGEIINANRLKVKSLIGLFFSSFFNVDNKFLRTFKDLTTKPEVVIDSYVYGFRRKYVNVIGYLGLVITIIGIQFFVLRRFFPELLSVDTLTSSETFEASKDIIDINAILESYYEYQGILTVLFIPIYAFASKLLFFDSKKYNLAEHFVINIYTTAHFFILWFLLTLITLPLDINYNILSQFAIVPMVIYMTYVFKRLYKIKTFDALARVILYYIIAMVVTIGVILAIAISYGFYMGYTGQLTPMNVH